MTTSTENLKDDHVHILKLTDIMEKIAQSPEPEIDHLESVVNLIKNFADAIHHAKEENLLFPLLGEKGYSKEQGPVAVMLHEHVAGRNYTMGMAENIQLYKNGNPASLNAIREDMLAYVKLLRNHIDKENNILFRMADSVLNNEEQQSLLTQFSEVEAKAGRQVIEDYVFQINKLSKIYNV